MIKSTPNQLETYKRYYRKHPWRVKLKKIRMRAKKKGLPFDLKEEDLVIPETCPVLGIPMRLHGNSYQNNFSVDRIDSNKGYLKDNVRVISHRANILKSDATPEELELILADVRKLHGNCNRTTEPVG